MDEDDDQRPYAAAAPAKSRVKPVSNAPSCKDDDSDCLSGLHHHHDDHGVDDGQDGQDGHDGSSISRDSLSVDHDDAESDNESWQEVLNDPHHQLPLPTVTPFEITIPISFAQQQAIRRANQEDPKRKKIEARRRKWEAEWFKSLHAVHLLCLLGVGMERNRWCNDPELQALMVGLIPSNLASAFLADSIRLGSNKGKGKASDSSAQLLTHLRMLLPFFKSRFLPTPAVDAWDNEGAPGLQRLVYSLLEAPEMERNKRMPLSPPSICLLFVATLRGLGLRTRLIASLHPAPASIKKLPPLGKQRTDACSSNKNKAPTIIKKLKDEVTMKRKRATATSLPEEDDDPVPSPPKKTIRKSPVRTSINAGCTDKERYPSTYESSCTDDFEQNPSQAMSSTYQQPTKSSSTSSKQSKEKNDSSAVSTIADMNGNTTSTKPRQPTRQESDSLPLDFYPIQYMAEVFDPYDEDWIPLNPLTMKMNEPTEWEMLAANIKNRQAQVHYVVAFDDAIGIKDVTRRYTVRFMGTSCKLRLTESGKDYLEETLKSFARDWDHTAVVESAKMKETAIQEPMPTTLAGFNNHPLYVLEKQLKSNETIHPLDKKHIVGTFRDMPVYPRKNVYKCKSREQWKREGRAVTAGHEPLKTVKARAITITKKREIAAYKQTAPHDGTGVDVTQTPLYAEFQTAWITPPPIQDGTIPKNEFGNIEVFHPCMVPPGAALVKSPGAAKAARTLGIDFARAVTGFDFKAGRSFPRLDGIVVAAEHVDIVIAAAEECELAAHKRAVDKAAKTELAEREKRIRAEKIKERVHAEFGSGGAHASAAEYASELEKTAVPFVPSARDDEADILDRALEGLDDDEDDGGDDW
ncbi:hypothetical protein SeMB42_g06763 [Synchytrium endobioticum]|uniref:Xeroderma pigmentosum group C-complementing protein n=1 Tax=Synchytrium endobioticum TaxID=286115 RepID=A0A507CFY5_9FUNG|nr:hypothetical protein SeMB42_g06763 [Synchytrium endobioticum]TPX48074.1 hypothetical protein SeLEV6574_g02254 [Synchytrium endobioticum]